VIVAANLLAPLRRIGRDRTGGALVEFALLAPVFITLMIGVLQIGVYMQNYSAIRSLAADAARFATVEYQKSNNMPEDDLEASIMGLALGPPYNLHTGSLDVDIDQVSSPVDGALKFDMNISYASPGFLPGFGLSGITLEYSRPLFVVDNTVAPS
jgi:Flp pilus assembly pilin Flp